MRYLSCKQAADAWEIAVTRATAAGDPAFRKVALAIRKYPVEAHQELTRWLIEVERELQERFEAELATRESRLEGRSVPVRSALKPTSRT